MIEILIYCHDFQRRLCWTLSSFCQQDGKLPEFVVNIASLRNNGDPSTEDVVDYYRNRIQIKHTIYNDSEIDLFAKPGWTRNRQIIESKADWFMCHSCDHVLPLNRMNAIYRSMKRYREIDVCMASIRNVNTDCDSANNIVNNYKDDLYIDHVYEKSSSIKLFDKSTYGRVCRYGPGGYLVFRRETLEKKRNGLYAPWKRSRDRHLFKQFMFSRNDIPFRQNMGHKIIKWPRMIHLNHRRDKDYGYHIEEQR